MADSQRGFALFLATIIILGALLIIVVSFSFLVLRQNKIIKEAKDSLKSYYAAESGIEDALLRLIKGRSYLANYSLSVASSTADINILASQGRKSIVSKGNFNNFFRTLSVTLVLNTVIPEFHYGAQVGEGGLKMENNSRIEGIGGVAGNVYSNGNIEGSSGAIITGDVFVASGMDLNQQWTVCNNDQIFGQSLPVADIAQSFKTNKTERLAQVSLYLKKSKNPTRPTIRILTDNSGSPSQTVLASATLDTSKVADNYGWINIALSNPPLLNANTFYWLLVDSSINSQNYWIWCKDQNEGYGNGSAKYSHDWEDGNPAWTDISGDLDIKIWLGGIATQIKDMSVYGDVHANTILTSEIQGDAYYQSIDQVSLDWLNNYIGSPGITYPDSLDPPVGDMPISEANINNWKLEAGCGEQPPISPCVINGDYSPPIGVSNLGPVTITGNLDLTNRQTLNITGTVYVMGNITLDGGASFESGINCDSSYGIESCVMVADGWIDIKNNKIFKGSGEDGSFLMLLTMSNCSGGTQTSGCANHNSAMDLHNNSTGAIFYASGGLIYLHNGVTISEIVGYKVQLENNAAIQYEQGLVNAQFSAGPGASWEVNNWHEVE